MPQGITVHLTGANIDDTAHVLVRRLVEVGCDSEPAGSELVQKVGSALAADHVCHLLSRHGVAVVATYPEAQPRGACLNIDIDPNDTPDFAAEKVLDELEEAGVVSLDSNDYSPEEEEQIRQRLADLGYVE